MPTTFKNFKSLLSNDLSNNRFNGSIPKEILSLSSLSTLLNLSKNLLNRPLPLEIALLKRVVAIDLSNNHLSGNIPSSIKNYKSMEELFMANNIFSGPITNTLQEVKGLNTLDLSSNQLSGSILAKVQNLLVLQFLNISFNHLEGVVPKGGVFKDLSKVHLEGNPKICLHLACVNSQGRGRKVAIVLVITSVLLTLVLCVILGSLFYITKSKSKITKTSEPLKGKYQMISYNELRRATRNFNEENLLGKGGFGLVYKGYLRQGITVAIKVLDHIKRTSSWKSFLEESKAIRLARHRNLVRLITSCFSIDFKNMVFMALVYEFMSNCSLED
jgi:hypothetical protein